MSGGSSSTGRGQPQTGTPQGQPPPTNGGQTGAQNNNPTTGNQSGPGVNQSNKANDPSKAKTNGGKNSNDVNEWIKIRYYSDEFKFKDLLPRVKGIKGSSDIHIHSIDSVCSHRSEAEVHIITFNYYGSWDSIGGLAGQLGIPCDLVSPAKVTFRVTADKSAKKQEPKKFGLELQSVAGVRKADFSGGPTATIWVDLEGLNSESVDNCAKYSGFRAVLDSHEFLDINVKSEGGKYKTLKKDLANTRGVLALQSDPSERKVTILTEKGKFDDKKIKEMVTGANFEVESINRR